MAIFESDRAGSWELYRTSGLLSWLLGFSGYSCAWGTWLDFLSRTCCQLLGSVPRTGPPPCAVQASAVLSSLDPLPSAQLISGFPSSRLHALSQPGGLGVPHFRHRNMLPSLLPFMQMWLQGIVVGFPVPEDLNTVQWLLFKFASHFHFLLEPLTGFSIFFQV